MKKIYLIVLSAFSIFNASSQCASTCSFVAAATATGTSTGVTISAPAGVLPNNIMIAAIHTGWCNSGSLITAPAGWTLIGHTSNTGSGCGSSNTTKQLGTFYKIATASEPANYTFTGTSSQWYVGGIVAYSGVNTTSPINAGSSKGAQDDCTNIETNTITTTAPCTRLVSIFFCSVNSSKTNIIPQASLTERLDVSTTGNHPWGNENLEISDEAMTSAGLVAVKSASLSTCSGTGWVTGSQIVALECAVTTSIHNNSLFGSSSIIPNPSTGVFEISLGENLIQPTYMEVYDCFGKIIKSGEINEKKTAIDLSSEPKGIYFLKIISPSGTTIQKIAVQ